MRIRSIKPEFWRSPDISRLPLSARLTFIGLWSYVDDNGVGWDHLPAIAADLFADDLASDPQETLRRVSGDLQTLFDAGLVVRWDTSDRHLLYIRSWEKHQVINRPSKGHEYPLPPAETLKTQETLKRHSGDTPETLMHGAGEQGNRGAGEQGNIHGQTSTSQTTAPLALVPADKDHPAGGRVSQTPTNHYPDEFEAWWQLWPKKQSKRDALKAWQAARKRIDHDTLTARTRAQVDAYRRDGTEPRYIPHPATWLRRDGWENDLSPAQNATRPTNGFATAAARLRAQHAQQATRKELG